MIVEVVAIVGEVVASAGWWQANRREMREHQSARAARRAAARLRVLRDQEWRARVLAELQRDRLLASLPSARIEPPRMPMWFHPSAVAQLAADDQRWAEIREATTWQ